MEQTPPVSTKRNTSNSPIESQQLNEGKPTVRPSIKPLFDMVLIEPLEDEPSTPGGIIIPDMAEEKPNRGYVLHVGEECQLVSPGDIVLYGKYAGKDIKFGENHLKVIHERDILAKVSTH
jgi:chaperonin GroES